MKKVQIKEINELAKQIPKENIGGLFCVYVLCGYNGQVFYVGKTTTSKLTYRLQQHFCEKINLHKYRYIKKYKQFISILPIIENLSEEKAYEVEFELLSLCSANKIWLTNKASGGLGGQSGCKKTNEQKHYQSEQKIKQEQVRRGLSYSVQNYNPNIHTDQYRQEERKQRRRDRYKNSEVFQEKYREQSAAQRRKLKEENEMLYLEKKKQYRIEMLKIETEEQKKKRLEYFRQKQKEHRASQSIEKLEEQRKKARERYWKRNGVYET